MSKKITSILIIFIAVFALTLTASADSAKKSLFWENSSGEDIDSLELAAGGNATITLKAKVPEGKTLKAYSFMIFYDDDIVAVEKVEAAPDAGIAPAVINDATPGEINVNGFDVMGVGEGTCSFVTIKLNAKDAGTGHISVMTSSFGSDAKNQFKPKGSGLKVKVSK